MTDIHRMVDVDHEDYITRGSVDFRAERTRERQPRHRGATCRAA
jgi:hypothetical protein